MKYFYVSIPKTGSTSVEATLDYPLNMLKISPHQRELRSPPPKLRTARNHGYKHRPLSFYKRNFPRKYDKYFKFSTVRNPWDKMLSEYLWFTSTAQNGPRPCIRKFYENVKSFPEFLNIFLGRLVRCRGDWQRSHWDQIRKRIVAGNEGDPRHRLPQIRFLKPLTDMDFICRFENLQQDFNIVCDKIGVPPRKLLHHNETRNRRRGKPYWEYYDDDTRDLVAEIYAEDIEAFGYEFGK